MALVTFWGVRARVYRLVKRARAARVTSAAPRPTRTTGRPVSRPGSADASFWRGTTVAVVLALAVRVGWVAWVDHQVPQGLFDPARYAGFAGQIARGKGYAEPLPVADRLLPAGLPVVPRGDRLAPGAMARSETSSRSPPGWCRRSSERSPRRSPPSSAVAGVASGRHHGRVRPWRSTRTWCSTPARC